MYFSTSKADMRSASATSSCTDIGAETLNQAPRLSSFELLKTLNARCRSQQRWYSTSSSSSLSSLSSTPSPSYRERRGSCAPSFVSRTPSYEVDDPITYINAVSFDGGGVRGAASARIIDIIMDDLSKATDTEVHPADYFEMFGGTSTGGLIAIMLGRLRVSTKALIETYTELSSSLFNSKRRLLRSIFRGCKYSGKLAERLFANIVADHAPEGADATLRNTAFGAPDVFVAAVDASNATGKPLIIRSYEIDSETENYAHRIVDAARATTAAPAYFPAKILRNGQTALDGGLMFNNPTNVLINEARQRHGKGVRFGLLLSIGTGEKGPICMPRCSSAASILSFTRAIGSIVTDSEHMHLRVEERFRESDLGTYLRINVPVIGDIHLDDYGAMPEIIKATDEYMNTPDMLEIRRQVVEVLIESRCSL